MTFVAECSSLTRTVDKMQSLTLAALGWSPTFERQFHALSDGDLVPGRVVGVERTVFRVQTEKGVTAATLAGRFHHEQATQLVPTVGDWVGVTLIDDGSKAILKRVLGRKTSLSRVSRSGRDPASATAKEQLLAANIDYVFIVTALDQDFSVRRIERYLTAVASGGAEPVVILNKADLCDDVPRFLNQVEAVAPDVPVHVLTALETHTLGDLTAYLNEGTTITLIGSSGVGKSTLVNGLLGAEIAPTGAVRAGDDEGRHTTTWREVFVLPGGGVLIDNPGLREIGAWSADVSQGFADITELSLECAYRNCTHTREPDCAVQTAVDAGELDPKRLQSYRRLAQEAERVAAWTSEGEQARREGKVRRARIKGARRAKGR